MNTSAPELFRATIFHTPGNPFADSRNVVAFRDGALAVSGGRIVACGDYREVAKSFPEAVVYDRRPGFILPGFVDTHIHYPQVRVIGGFGHCLLDWLDRVTLPEESRLSDGSYADALAREFVRALVSHGTTTALVFGSHFRSATETLFHYASVAGLRIVSGLVLSDRLLRSDLLTTVDAAYIDSNSLIRSISGYRRAGYCVTPRFAMSTSEPMLDLCRALMKEHPGIRFQTHMNENLDEIANVAKLFPYAGDYLGVYEHFDLAGPRSMFAHNVHASDAELWRLAASKSWIAHCPCSNAALGSGVFPLQRHLAAGVRFALGTDVGGGTGFGMMKEALQMFLQQRVAAVDTILTPAHLLYLSTRAGAEALGLADITGDFSAGKFADFVTLTPPPGSVLAGVVRHANSLEHQLTALFALGGAESVREVRVEGDVVFDVISASPRAGNQERNHSGSA